MTTIESPRPPAGWEEQHREIQAAEEHRAWQRRELREGRRPRGLRASEVEELEIEIRREDERSAFAAARAARDPLHSIILPNDVPAEPGEGRPWLVPGFLVESAMGLVAGKKKQGKSTTAVELAVSLSTGTPLFGLPEYALNPAWEPAPVLYFQTEDADERVKRDLDAMCEARGLPVEGHGVHRVPRRPRFNLLQDDAFDSLLRWIKVYGYRYVIFNPIQQLVGSINLTTWDNGPDIVDRLNHLRDVGCPPIITIPVRENARVGLESILAPTVFGGWYESAILVSSTLRSTYRDFTFRTDNSRDRDLDGVSTIRLRGLGVGSWEYPPTTTAAGADDGDEHRANVPTNQERYRALVTASPSITDAEASAAIGVTERQIRRYRSQ